MSITKVRKALAEGKCVFGTQQTLKQIKQGKVKRVFLARNCPLETKASIEQYAKWSKFEVIELNEPSDELMLICKKNFPVTVLSC